MAIAQAASRKRPAPGTTPLEYPPQAQQMPQNTNSNTRLGLTDDQFLRWGQMPQSQYEYVTNTGDARSHIQAPNQNAMVQRSMNQASVGSAVPNSQWANDPSYTGQISDDPTAAWSDDIEELQEKAQQAKREAQSKRKQIPPFVLKLHSFLENPKNTDLIRWADDGKSFIVLNEDEFANKLIPELFKHNNYASFVRQLNMYGFHKKVGLSDNSMRASERKAKSPSEYWNPFFRQGYPDLLWLIQKPKSATAGTKNKARMKSEERDDEDELPEDLQGFDGIRSRPQLTLGQGTGGQGLSQEQLESVTRELVMIRNQQMQITRMLGQLKREHDALVNQASDYQNKHSRHENSINAILTFLATLYNRSIQNHEGAQAQDIAKMFASTLHPDSKSGIVDGSNFVFDMPEGSTPEQMQQPYKRSPLLLTDGSDSRIQALSPATSAASPRPRNTRQSSALVHTTSPRMPNVEEIFDPEVKPPRTAYHSANQQSQDMMSLIHDHNARNSGASTPVQDFSHVLSDLENSGGTTPVNAAQREDMLRMFQPSSSRPSSSHQPQQNGNRALTSPARSNSQQQLNARLAQTQDGLDSLARMQAAQDRSVENLTNLLQPLSPTGSIPGIHDGQDVPPPPLNIDDFLSASGDYFADLPSDGDGNFDFSSMNNTAYNGNSNNAPNAFDFNDDDPLFTDNNLNVNYDDVGNSLTGGSDLNNAQQGRVESVASSSDAPSPTEETSHSDGERARKRSRIAR